LSEPPKGALDRIEAALYSSGRPLDIDQLAKVAGTSSSRRAVAMVHELMGRLNASMGAVEVVEYPGSRFAMQLKPQFNQIARRFATRPLLTKAALRTLSYIAYFQPLAASELVLRRSSVVYKHLKELEEVNFVSSERQGRTKVYRTTPRFADYFGLSTDTTTLKRQLEARNLTLR
jgi:segregation and condensation protein B